MLILGLVIPLTMISIYYQVSIENDGSILFVEMRHMQNKFLERNQTQDALDSVVSAIEKAESEDLDVLRESEFYEELEKYVLPIDAMLFVQINPTEADSQLVYESAEGIKGLYIPNEIGTAGKGIKINTLENQMLIHYEIRVPLNDHEDISVAVLSKLTRQSDLRSFFISNLMVGTIIYLVCYIILAYIVSQSITRPLERLKKATKELEKGNYDHSISEFTNDKIGEVSKSFEDMRERLKYSEELKAKYESNRRELIANLSHDIKTPLTSVKLHISAINDGVANTEEKRLKYWNVIGNKINVIECLLDELFLYSKLDIGAEKFEFRRVPINSFIEDIVEDWRLEYSDHEIKFTWKATGEQEVHSMIDIEKMRRVLNNVFENAVKYAEVKPLLLNIETQVTKEQVKIVLMDNGVGMLPEKADRIFDRLYRGDESRNSNAGGSGLGLSISKRIIEAHDGTIRAVTDVNKGMRIIIELPVQASEADINLHEKGKHRGGKQ